MTRQLLPLTAAQRPFHPLLKWALVVVSFPLLLPFALILWIPGFDRRLQSGGGK